MPGAGAPHAGAAPGAGAVPHAAAAPAVAPGVAVVVGRRCAPIIAAPPIMPLPAGAGDRHQHGHREHDDREGGEKSLEARFHVLSIPCLVARAVSVVAVAVFTAGTREARRFLHRRRAYQPEPRAAAHARSREPLSQPEPPEPLSQAASRRPRSRAAPGAAAASSRCPTSCRRSRSPSSEVRSRSSCRRGPARAARAAHGHRPAAAAPARAAARHAAARPRGAAVHVPGPAALRPFQDQRPEFQPIGQPCFIQCP